MPFPPPSSGPKFNDPRKHNNDHKAMPDCCPPNGNRTVIGHGTSPTTDSREATAESKRKK